MTNIKPGHVHGHDLMYNNLFDQCRCGALVDPDTHREVIESGVIPYMLGKHRDDEIDFSIIDSIMETNKIKTGQAHVSKKEYTEAKAKRKTIQGS